MTAKDLERTLGGNVRQVRIDRRLTQAELAELANVSIGALRHLEGGVGSTTATLAKVLRALGREEWLDTLAPASTPFNPLKLLEDRKKEARRTKGSARVRHRSTATP
jgi:transcriptional regulator with XRE-family HTH domain